MSKKLVGYFLKVVIAGSLLLGIFVYLADPFYHFHGPLFGLEPYLDNAVYQTPGAARHLSYDSAIVGSSMTENFHTTWFDEELGWHTVKLSYSGARTSDLAAILGQVFLSSNEVKNIVLDLNAYQLTEDSTTCYVERPEYLYDENPFSDVQYFLNRDVLCAALGRTLAYLGKTSGDMDSSYCWEDPELFGLEKTRKAYELVRSEPGFEKQNPDAEEIQEYVDNCLANLSNITPYIEDHPTTHFLIFYPPYSIAYWQTLQESGTLEKIIAVYRASVETLLQYENVSLYYFQDEKEIIADLGSYRDLCHYTPQVNRYIFECIKEDRDGIDESNYFEHLNAMYELACHYPYEDMWE